MKRKIEVYVCINYCPFQENSMEGMYCNHPYFDNKEPYAEYIITNDTGMTRVPNECPLKKEPIITTVCYTKEN